MLNVVDVASSIIEKQTWRGTKMPTVWFIRHGESEANAGLPTIHPAQVRLTAKGHKQAVKVAHLFKRTPSLIVTSSYERAQETAEPTCRRFSSVHCEVWETVREFTYLALTERRETTKQDRQPFVDAYWQRFDPSYVDGADVESFRQFIQRVADVLEALKYGQHDFVAVFSHEQFIMAARWLLLIRPTHLDAWHMQHFRCFLCTQPLPNGAVMQVDFQEDAMSPHITMIKP
jgi:probable phosphoglycerate mutase